MKAGPARGPGSDPPGGPINKSSFASRVELALADDAVALRRCDQVGIARVVRIDSCVALQGPPNN